MGAESRPTERRSRTNPADPEDPTGVRPRGARSLAAFRAHQGSLISGCVAILLAVATPSLVGNITGTIAVQLRVSGSQLTWAVSVVWLGSAATAYLSGSVADRVGRKRVLVVSAGLTAVGAAVSAVAGSLPVLLTGQVLAGAGAGGLGSLSLAVVTAASRSRARRPVYLAAFAGSLAAGPIVSSLIDAFLATSSSYRNAFLGLAVLSVLVTAIIVLLGEESRADRRRRIDAGGQVTMIIALTAMLWGVIEGSSTSWGKTAVVTAFIVAVVAAIGFVIFERRPGAMLDLSVLRHAEFSVAAVLGLVSWFVLIGSAYLYSIRVTLAQGHTPFFAAMGLIVFGGVAGIAGFACRPVLARLANSRVLVVGGLICAMGADLWLALVPAGNHSFTSMLGFLVLLGIGQSATTAGVSAAAMNSVHSGLESMAASTQATMRVVGPPIGTAVLGAVVFSRSQSEFSARLVELNLTDDVGRLATGINAHDGVLGIFGSGIGAKVPPVGQAAEIALGEATALAALVAAGLCAIMAAVAAVFLRGSAPQEYLRPDHQG